MVSSLRIALVSASCLFLMSCSESQHQQNKVNDALAEDSSSPAIPVVGGDVDEHGCKASAGFQWCAATGRCERPWELAKLQQLENTSEAFTAFCQVASDMNEKLINNNSSTQTTAVLVGNDKDEHGCIASAGYQWCASLQQCVRPWELAKEKGFENTPEAFASFCQNQGSGE